jgi:hypothetical protein
MLSEPIDDIQYKSPPKLTLHTIPLIKEVSRQRQYTRLAVPCFLNAKAEGPAEP